MRPVTGPDHSFWDHLSATRADEYAHEEELAQLPIPPAPAASANTAHGRTLRDMGLTADPNFAGVSSSDQTLPERLAHGDTWPEDPAALDMSAQDAAQFHDDADLWPEQTYAPLPLAAAQAQPRRKRAKPGALRSGRFAYRLQRVWLTPFYRRALTLGVPCVALILSIAAYLIDQDRRAGLLEQGQALYAFVVDRPEFMVTEMRLVGSLPPALATAIQEVITPELPQSSFRLDLVALRAELERLDAIRLADLRLTADGALAISVTQRVPAAVWRSSAGLEVLDAEGVRIGLVMDRAALPELPLVAGDGADRRIGEALDLIEAASPLEARLLGLVRMGERRWDVVLDRDQIIRLPETGPVAALEGIIALDQAQDVLARDVLVADLRNPSRPVLQVSAGALDTIRALRGASLTERNAQ